MREFAEKDCLNGRIPVEKSDLIFDGLTGSRGECYGARLNTGYKINFCGRLYRVYCTIYSNTGTCWFRIKGRKIIVY